jgi:hypothetical protein
MIRLCKGFRKPGQQDGNVVCTVYTEYQVSTPGNLDQVLLLEVEDNTGLML